MSEKPFLERRSPLRISYALLTLLVFFFLLPSAFRAARLSLGTKENDVKDWLPADFAETAELEWFADHFAGEAFVVATWEGCTADDQRLKLLSQKLHHESEDFDPSKDVPADQALSYSKARAFGIEKNLLLASESFDGWGGQREKWLQTPEGQWYYIKPSGQLYRWDEPVNAMSGLMRNLAKARGNYELTGQLVTAFGKPPGAGAGSPVANPFYNDPSLLCAPLFHTVQTGEQVVDQLAAEGGPLWPRGLMDPERRPIVARRLAMQRLTGLLFAPAVPDRFGWTGKAFLASLGEERTPDTPADFVAKVDYRISKIVDEQFDGNFEALTSAPEEKKSDVWYAVWDSVKVDPPPRLTCVLVTLTDLAQDKLVHAIGRGVLGQPRGRLLQLADQSGVFAARPPSMAPPPFNVEPAIATATMPALRLGGPTVDNMAIDEEGSVTLVRLVGYSMLLGVVLSYFCFRSIKITVMIFVVGGSSAMLSLAMVWWTGGGVDAILMSMPSLVYVLGLSGAIHVINYYRDEVRSRGTRGAAGRALRHAVIPCTLASFTTAIGLASLFTSNLKPISNFGFYAAVGVMSTLGILFSYLPAALHTFVPEVDRGDPSDSDQKDESDADQPRHEGRLSIWWANVGRKIASNHALVTVTCLAVLLGCAVGMKQIATSVQLLKLFDSKARILRDYAWLETHFGKLVPMELIVRMPPSMQAEQFGSNQLADSSSEAKSAIALPMLQRIEAISRIRTVVSRTLGEPGMDIVGQSASVDTFLPPLLEADNGYNILRATFNRDLKSARDELLANDYLKIEKSGPYKDSELWRISLRVAALSDVDYGIFISTMRQCVSPVLSAYQTRNELVSALAKPDESGNVEIDPQSKVMIVGAALPKPVSEVQLLAEDQETFLARNAYLATLAEVLASDPIKRPRWLNLTKAKAKELVASDRWEKVCGGFDAVIWVGGDGFKKDDFRFADHLVDARGADMQQSTASLTEDRIPTVNGGGEIQAIYTGVIPVVYKAQRTLLTSLADSIALAFVLIAAVMFVLLNPGATPIQMLRPGNVMLGIAAGAVAMVPNVFPVLLVFGLMCHLGLEIDIGTMMTASVAMGVAVDDTIHFLSWFRENLDKGKTRVEAVIETYRRVGPAMTQTTIVGGLGLFVFALSTFTPTQRFGTLMLVMLAAALIGDLILLPALLAGPLGRVFKPRVSRSPIPRSSTSESSPKSDQNLVRRQKADAHPQQPTEMGANDVVETSPGNSLPQLRVRFPGDRIDRAHGTKKR